MRKQLKEVQQSNSNWETIVTTSDPYYISVLKLKLEEYDIPYLIIDQRDSSYKAFGYIYLQVLREDAPKAQKIVNSQDE